MNSREAQAPTKLNLSHTLVWILPMTVLGVQIAFLRWTTLGGHLLFLFTNTANEGRRSVVAPRSASEALSNFFTNYPEVAIPLACFVALLALGTGLIECAWVRRLSGRSMLGPLVAALICMGLSVGLLCWISIASIALALP